MEDELHELIDSAIYKEIASEALYQGLVHRTDDPGAAQLMRELAGEEERHIHWLTDLKERGDVRRWRRGAVEDLRISEHLKGPDSLEGAGLQDTLIFAIKREQHAVEFYSRMTGMLRTSAAKQVCQKLANEEIRHKVKLELFYDSLFLDED